MPSPDAAAILLVGNELLSGRVEDANLPFLARELWACGVRVRGVEIVRDDVDVIAEAVRRLSSRHDLLFTTGGIGPTHDDVTVAGVAAAFGVPVVRHPDLEARLRAHFRERLNASHLRMAEVPEGADLVGGASSWPTIHIRNTYVLPGVPEILRRKFSDLRERFAGRGFHRHMLGLAADEATLAPLLETVCTEYPGLEVGSYPESHRVLVTLESTDHELLARAAARLDELTSGMIRVPE